jgi:hypothetical protein
MYEPAKGTSFSQAVKDCQTYLRKRTMDDIVMVFNDIHVRVSVDSNSSDLEIIYNLKHLLRRHIQSKFDS